MSYSLSGKISGLGDIEISKGRVSTRVKATSLSDHPQASFTYPKEVIEAVRTSGYEFNAYDSSSYRNDKADVVSCEAVASRMEQYNYENENAHLFFSVGNSCYTEKSYNEIVDGVYVPRKEGGRSSVPVIFECCAENLPEDSLVPSIILCAFGWGVECIKEPYNSLYAQDRGGYYTYVTLEKWNKNLSYESHEEGQEIRSLRIEHEDRFKDSDSEYEFGPGDFILCCLQPEEGMRFSKTERVCAAQLTEYANSTTTPFIAFFRRRIRNVREVVWAKYFGPYQYTVSSIDPDGRNIYLLDAEEREFAVKWKTWHPALAYNTYASYVKELKRRSDVDVDTKLRDSQSQFIESDLASMGDDEVFQLPGVTPLSK